jgi:hypothetical protein
MLRLENVNSSCLGFEPFGKRRKGFASSKGLEADRVRMRKPTGEKDFAQRKAAGRVCGRRRATKGAEVYAKA